MSDTVGTATWTVETHSAAETAALGEALGRHLRAGDMVALIGALGTGKTVLAQGIARALGVKVPLTSPTFILVNEYPLPQGGVLYHADMYRLDDAVAEASALGLAEMLGTDGIALVEWAERVESLLPDEYLRVELAHLGEDKRRLHLTAYGARYETLLDAVRAAR